MAAVLSPKPTPQTSSDPWRGFVGGWWQNHVDVREFIQKNYTPYEGDESFLAGPTERTRKLWEKLLPIARRGAREGRTRRLPGAVRDSRPRARLHRQGLRDHRRPADRCAAQARDHALGGWRVVEVSLKSYDFEPDPKVAEIFTQVPQDPQRRRLRRLHARHQEVPQLPHHHRASGQLRPRPHHRRLPPRGALRRGLPHQGTGARQGRARRPTFDRGGDSTARGARRADSRAQRAQADGQELWVRHRRTGDQRARSDAMALLRLPRRDQAAERGGDVGGPRVDVPRHLLRARPARGHAHRERGAGDHRRLRHQAAPRAVPAGAGIQPVVLRRSGVGDRRRRRHGRRRPDAGDQVQLPDAEYALHARPGARAEHHHLLVDQAAGGVQAVSPPR